MSFFLMIGWMSRAGNYIESYESLAVLRNTMQESPDFHSHRMENLLVSWGRILVLPPAFATKMSTAVLGIGGNG